MDSLSVSTETMLKVPSGHWVMLVAVLTLVLPVALGLFQIKHGSDKPIMPAAITLVVLIIVIAGAFVYFERNQSLVAAPSSPTAELAEARPTVPADPTATTMTVAPEPTTTAPQPGTAGEMGNASDQPLIQPLAQETGPAEGTAPTTHVEVVTTENGVPAAEPCYQLIGYGDESCDDNGDGIVTFMDIPAGTYTLHQTRDLGADRSVPDTTLTVAGDAANGSMRLEAAVVAVPLFSSDASAPEANTTDTLAFTESTTDGSTTEPSEAEAPPVAFDELAATPPTEAEASLSAPDEGNAADSASDPNAIESATIATMTEAPQDAAPAPTATPPNVTLMTLDPASGSALAGACYELVGYDHQACDDGGNGQVAFAAIAPGSYTVHQTQSPGGLPAIDDFEIVVESNGIPLGYIVKQAPGQNTPGARHVSVVLTNVATGEKIPGGTCVQLVGASEPRCEGDIIDGQIAFLDVPEGSYAIEVTALPDGFIVDPAFTGTQAVVDAQGTPSNLFVYIGLQPAP